MVLIHAEEMGDRWHGIGSGTYGGEGWHEDIGEEWNDDNSGTYSDFSTIINNLSGYCLPSLIRNFTKLTSNVSKVVLDDFQERLTRLTNIDYLVGDDGRLFMESWNSWKASHRFCWRWNFRMNVLFAVSFFAYSFSLLFLATCLRCNTLTAVSQITELESGFLVEV